MIVKVLILAALVRLLIATNNPFMCSGIYAAVGFIFALISGAGFLAAILGGAISFVMATIWFWLLNRFEDRTAIFWFIAALGIFLGFV
jgi:hypothetical protein